MMTKKYSHLVLLVLIVMLLEACAAKSKSTRYSMRQDRAPKYDVNASRIADAIPRVEPKSKYGNPASYVVMGQRYHVMNSAKGYRQKGIASWYGSKFHGHRTSSGEPYNMYAMTAAHKHLPLPTYVRVTNVKNKRSIIVKVNDRGPFHENRIIDLSYVAAKKLGIGGTGMVEVQAIDPAQYQRGKRRRISAVDHFKRDKTTAQPVKTTTQASKAATKPAEARRVYLQVGAFSERSNADELHDQLAALLEKGEINTGYNVKNKLYRVRIGPLANAEEANKLAAKITASGIASPRVVLD